MKYNIETELGAVAQLVERGELVALCRTNTYLVCSALNEESISKALKIKGKHDNPLILYSANLTMAEKYVRNISHEAYVTAQKLWPSATIFILPVKKSIPNIVTCNLDAAAFACPTEKVLRQISCLINSPLVLIKIDPVILEELNYIAVAECDLPFIRKRPVIFDGRDDLRRVDAEDLLLRRPITDVATVD